MDLITPLFGFFTYALIASLGANFWGWKGAIVAIIAAMTLKIVMCCVADFYDQKKARQAPSSPSRKINLYNPEEQLLLSAIPAAQSILTKTAVRELCVNLYFNWTIESFELLEHQLSVKLARRGVTTTKRFAYKHPKISEFAALEG
jgi:hypothetical protein